MGRDGGRRGGPLLGRDLRGVHGGRGDAGGGDGAGVLPRERHHRTLEQCGQCGQCGRHGGGGSVGGAADAVPGKVPEAGDRVLQQSQRADGERRQGAAGGAVRGAAARRRVLPAAGGDARIPLAVHGAGDARLPRGDPPREGPRAALPAVLLAARRGGDGRGGHRRRVLRGEPDTPRALPRRGGPHGRGVPAGSVPGGGSAPCAPPPCCAVSEGHRRCGHARAGHVGPAHGWSHGAAQVRGGPGVLRVCGTHGAGGVHSAVRAVPEPAALPVRAQAVVVRVGAVLPLPVPATGPPGAGRAADGAAAHLGERPERGDDPVGSGPRGVGLVSGARRDVPGHGAGGRLSVLRLVDAVADGLLLPAGAGAAGAGSRAAAYDAGRGERRGSYLSPRRAGGRGA